MALVATDYWVYWLASDCQTCIGGITDAGVLETLGGFTVEAVDNLTIGDAALRWSTADANAEAFIVDLPTGDSEEVPLMVLGQAIEAVDLGFFDGYTETNLAVVDLAKTSWVAFGFGVDEAAIPCVSCGGVATYIKFLDMVHIGAFNSTTQGSGIPLATATSGNFRVYSDDAGAAIVNTGVGDTRGLLSRFLLTVDHSANEVRFSGAMGHVKSYDGIWGNEQVSGVYGYAELVRNSATLTLTDYGITAGIIGCVENIGVVTIDTNHILAGLAAISKITGDLTATGKTAGLLVTTYDTTNWSDSTARIDWEYGLYIDSATVAGIEIADNPTVGLLISGAAATGIKITGTNATAALQLGVSGTPAGDFVWYGTTAGYVVTFDVDGDTNGSLLIGADTKGIMFNLYGDVTGCGVFWDPSTDTNGTLAFGATGGSKGIDVVFYGDTSGAYATWDQSTNDLVFFGAASLVIEGTLTPNTTRTDHALVIGGRSTDELTVTFAGGAGAEHFEPVQVNFDFVGTNPASTSTVNVWQGGMTLDTGDLANVRLKWSDLLTTVSKACTDVYIHQAEIVLGGTTTVSSEVAVVGLVLDGGAGTITCSAYRGIGITMRGSGTPANADAVFINVVAGVTVASAVDIQADGTITTGIVFDCVPGSGTITNLLSCEITNGPAVATAEAGDGAGSIKILVDGAAKYLHYWANAA